MTVYTPQWSAKPTKKWYQFMLDIAWPEIMIIGIVAVVAIGPKDLPKVMNTLGRMAGKARNMMADVQRSMEQMNYEAEVADKLKNTPNPIVTPASAMEAPAAKHHDKHHHVQAHDASVKPAVTPDDPNEHLGST